MDYFKKNKNKIKYLSLLLFETLFVAVYSCLVFFFIKKIFSFFSLLKSNINLILILILIFITGFFKHFFGYYFGLQYSFCEGREKIKMDKNKNKNKNNQLIDTRSFMRLCIESLVEGIVFIFVYAMIRVVYPCPIKNLYVVVFLIGLFLHLSFEFLGIHELFCSSTFEKGGAKI